MIDISHLTSKSAKKEEDPIGKENIVRGQLALANPKGSRNHCKMTKQRSLDGSAS